MASVGVTTTLVVIAGERPFGSIRYDPHYRRASVLQDAGSAIAIIASSELAAMLHAH